MTSISFPNPTQHPLSLSGSNSHPVALQEKCYAQVPAQLTIQCSALFLQPDSDRQRGFHCLLFDGLIFFLTFHKVPILPIQATGYYGA